MLMSTLIGVEFGLPLLRLAVQPKNCCMPHVMAEKHLLVTIPSHGIEEFTLLPAQNLKKFGRL
jgi:hypothetical protein